MASTVGPGRWRVVYMRWKVQRQRTKLKIGPNYHSKVGPTRWKWSQKRTTGGGELGSGSTAKKGRRMSLHALEKAVALLEKHRNLRRRVGVRGGADGRDTVGNGQRRIKAH